MDFDSFAGFVPALESWINRRTTKRIGRLVNRGFGNASEKLLAQIWQRKIESYKTHTAISHLVIYFVGNLQKKEKNFPATQ